MQDDKEEAHGPGPDVEIEPALDRRLCPTPFGPRIEHRGQHGEAANATKPDSESAAGIVVDVLQGDLRLQVL